MNLFSKYGKDIFKKTQIMQFKNIFDTKYSAESFEGVLKNYFKDCRLSNCLPETNVIVTAVNRVDNKDYIFRSMEALLNRDKDFYMRDVARSTSAAPTYFPSA
jgi:patatin-like phospholipase/acyl hydrolase